MLNKILKVKANTSVQYFIMLLSLLGILVFTQCSRDVRKNKDIVVIGITADVATLNPMFAFDLQEGHLTDLLYLKPAIEKWNDSLGLIEFEPMLAESWIVKPDSNLITFNLRDNLFWSDGEPITIEDIIFSFDVYSDPVVNSRLYGLFGNFFTDENLHIDFNKSFRKNSEKSLTIFFKDFKQYSFLDFNFAILPAHAYKNVLRENIETSELNYKPITSGPFKLLKWDRDQKIHLVADSLCYLFNKKNIQEIIFKIIADDFSMFTQLTTGEIDLIENLEAERVKKLKDFDQITVGSIKGRDFDYLGWNNIDPAAFQQKQIKANKFFGSAKVRKALSISINRNEIFNSIIGESGQIYDSPISPVFKSYLDSSLFNFEYNPSLAQKMLEEEGWKDLNGNGTLEKNNIEFSFEIYSNIGNPIREYAANIIKNNLKEVGVEAKIIFIDKGGFIDGLINKKYDAWLSGWTVQIPINLDNFSDPNSEKGMFNFSSYNNHDVNTLLSNLNPTDSQDKYITTYKTISKIFRDTEPITVLFWQDNIIAYNKRINNIKFSPLGLFTYAWDWKIEK
ncbi:MAG: ABC transporter substrate-binding protein [Ignavibacterium sp.]|jgi:peptide/nickel transport system substrate-binding protein|nr:ABC transporter substrate-binding protein [Ignavibacterium sp.]